MSKVESRNSNCPKTALLTGATGGIGRVLLRHLLTNGYTVLATGRNALRIQELAQALRGAVQAQRLFPLLLDVSEAYYTQHLPLAIREHLGDRLDLVVCAHGADPVTLPSADVAPDAWQRVLTTDVSGTFYVMQRCYAPLAKPGGSVVLLSSFHALATYPQRAPYAAAKTAILGLTRALAVEWARDGIRVNALCPAQVESPRTRWFCEQAHAHGQDLLEDLKRRTPARQLVAPEDLAETVLWLTRTPSVTGQAIVLDHGWLSSAWHQDFVATEAEEGICHAP